MDVFALILYRIQNLSMCSSSCMNDVQNNAGSSHDLLFSFFGGAREFVDWKMDSFVCLFVCLLGNLFSSGFNPSCVFALYSIEGS